MKKIFAIFSIFLILSVSLIPCFAQDIERPVYYNQLGKNFIFYKYSAIADCSVSYDSSDNTWTLGIYSSGYTNSIRYNLPFSFPKNHRILIIMHGTYSGNYSLILGFPSTSTNFNYNSTYSFFYCISKFNSDSTYFLLQSNSSFNGIVSDLLFVDLDSIYADSSLIGIDHFLADFPFFATDSVDYTTKSFYNPSLKDGFQSILDIVFHSWDQIFYFFDQYTSLTVWLTVSISLSAVVVIIILLYKRNRS